MKRIFLISFAASLATLVVSCDTQVKEKRMARIDSLGIHLNHVEDVLAMVDTVALENWKSHISTEETWLWDNATDTLDPQPAILVGDLFRTKKYIGKVQARYSEVKKEAAYAKKQIATLREDVKNSFYSKEEFEGYFITEADAMEKLAKAADDLENANGSLVERYKKILPQATLVLDSIRNAVYDPTPRKKK